MQHLRAGDLHGDLHRDLHGDLHRDFHGDLHGDLLHGLSAQPVVAAVASVRVPPPAGLPVGLGAAVPAADRVHGQSGMVPLPQAAQKMRAAVLLVDEAAKAQAL